MRVCGVRGDEIAPDIFHLGQIEGMDILGFGESDSAREEQEIECVGGGRGGGVPGYDVEVLFAAGGWVVTALSGSVAGFTAKYDVIAGKTGGERRLGGRNRRERR